MTPFVRSSHFSPRHAIASVAVVGIMVALVIWSILLNATDIIGGLLDHTGATPTRRQ